MAEHKNSVYRKISEDICSKIKSGEYAVGSMLAPERKLMDVYGVERTTIRRALEILVKDGLIVKKTGLGTFVADPEDATAQTETDKVKTITVKHTGKKEKLTALPKKIKMKKDYMAAAAIISEKLEELGHRKIMCILQGEALAAFSGYAVKNGKYDSDLYIDTEDRYDADYILQRTWRSLRSPKPTAIVVSTAEQAEKIKESAERLRISIPEEVSVVAVETNKASGAGGCAFDVKKTEKRIIGMLEYVPAEEISDMSINVVGEYVKGDTIAEAKSDRVGSGSMSAYLL